MAERAWRRGAQRLALRDPQRGLEMAQARRLPVAAYLAAFPTAEEAKPFAEKLIDQGVTTARDAIAYKPDEKVALEWTLNDRLCVDDFFYQYVGRASADTLGKLFKADKINAERWLKYGNMPANVLVEQMALQSWSPIHVTKNTWLPNAVANHLVEDKGFDARTLVMLSNLTWHNALPLTAQHAKFVGAYRSLASLMDTLSVMVTNWEPSSYYSSYDASTSFARPHNSIEQGRYAYARRLMAAYFQGALAYVEAPTQTSADAEATFECQVCAEDLPVAKGRKPAACQHPADICEDCAQQWVSSANRITCFFSDCDNPVTPNDILAFGMTGEQADAWAVKIVDTYVKREVNWMSCITTHCMGGIDVPPGEHFSWKCVACNVTQVAANYIVDLEKDADQIRQLIADLGDGPMDGKKRECCHCGNAGEHVSGCSSMVCGGCGNAWSFNHGPSWEHDFQGYAQTYVPRTGLLVKAGIYKGLEPGATGVDPVLLQRTAHHNAVRLGLITDTENRP